MSSIPLYIVVCAACGRGSPPPPVAAAASPAPAAVAPPARLVEGRYYVEADSPDPLACRADGDCVADTVTDEGGCCIRSPAPLPQSWAWHTWVTARRRSSACAVECPPLPVPMGPQRCATLVHCAAGRCTNECK